MPTRLLSVLRNPIFEKEFVALCRTRKWFVVRTGMVGVGVAAIWLLFATVGPETIANPAELGRVIFGTLAVLEVLIVAAVTPALVADVIVSERRRRTLDILLTTPIRPAGIVLGKVLSRLSLVLVLAAAAFPMVTVALLYGGVRGEQVLALAGLVLGTALFTGGVALLVSAHARRLGTAAVLSYVLPIAWCFAWPLVLLAADRLGHGADVMEMPFLVGPHPFFATWSVAMDEGWSTFANAAVPPWLVWLLTGAAVGAITTALAVLRLVRERHEVGLAPSAPQAAPVRHRTRLRRMRRPMLWKEAHLRNPTHSKALFRIVLALLILAEILLFATADHELDEAGLHIFFATVEASLLLLVVAVNGATSVVSEREQGTLDLVHVTLVRPDDVTTAKVAGALRSVAVLAAVPCAHLVVATFVSDLPLLGAAAFALTFGILLCFFAVFGVGFSVVSRRPAHAILRATLLYAGLFVVFPLAVAFLLLVSNGRVEESLVGVLLCGCPAAIPAGVAQYATDRDPGRIEKAFLLGAILWSAVYLFATILWYRYLGTLYARVRRREQGAA